MSNQLTLADVEAKQYLRIDGKEYWYDGTVLNGDLHVLVMTSSGETRHFGGRREAQATPVELMELVPKDREQVLRPWEKKENLAEPWVCYSDFETWFREKLAPMEGVDPDNDAAWETFLEESPVLAHTTLYSVFCDAVDAAIKKAKGE